MPDVYMESVDSCEYDPDDLDLEDPMARMANTTLVQAPNLVPCINLSATVDLKEINGRDLDEDRAPQLGDHREDCFQEVQAPDGEMCLVAGGLLTGPAHNWYRQLSRSI